MRHFGLNPIFCTETVIWGSFKVNFVKIKKFFFKSCSKLISKNMRNFVATLMIFNLGLDTALDKMILNKYNHVIGRHG